MTVRTADQFDWKSGISTSTAQSGTPAPAQTVCSARPRISSRTARKFGPSWKLTLIQLGRPAAIWSRVAGRGRARRSTTMARLLVERCVRADGLEAPLQAVHEAP